MLRSAIPAVSVTVILWIGSLEANVHGELGVIVFDAIVGLQVVEDSRSADAASVHLNCVLTRGVQQACAENAINQAEMKLGFKPCVARIPG